MHVEQYLTNQRVWFELIKHRPTYTAQTTARALHAEASEVAKSVMLKAGDRWVLALVPAGSTVSLSGLREQLNVADIVLVHEGEIQKKFPDCELGALPPFGSQYGMTTIVDEALSTKPEIIFEGNTHIEAIRMRFADYVKLEHPLVADVVKHPALPSAEK